MGNYNQMVARQRKWMLYLLAVLIIGVVITPYTRIFLGLLLGSIISFYNIWVLQRRIDVIADSVIKNNPKTGLGTLTRLAAAGLGVIIAIRFDDYFNVIAYIVGLMASYLIIMLDFLLFKNADIKERGE